MILINDTLVVIGVSLSVYKAGTLDIVHMTHVRRLKMLLLGTGLYKVSSMLLKSGNLYYRCVYSALASLIRH